MFLHPFVLGMLPRMRREQFEKLVVEGYERLPEWVRQKIQNVALLVEDAPSDDVRKREGLSGEETLLGYYHGIPLASRGDFYGMGATLPDTITIYQIPILEMADEEMGADVRDADFEERVKQIVAETVWHEFAHHFGMDEHEVREREDAREHEHDGYQH